MFWVYVIVILLLANIVFSVVTIGKQSALEEELQNYIEIQRRWKNKGNKDK